jgi:hypothetical protein
MEAQTEIDLHARTGPELKPERHLRKLQPLISRRQSERQNRTAENNHQFFFTSVSRPLGSGRSGMPQPPRQQK